MNIIPWRKHELFENPVTTELADLQREVNCLFENFFGESVPEATAGFAPLVDITETDTSVVVKADLPGLADKDIEVTLEDNALVLKGEKSEEKEDKRTGAYRLERSYGSFYRRIPLPVEIEADQVEATFDRGVLTVNLPKRAEVKTGGVKVNIKTA